MIKTLSITKLPNPNYVQFMDFVLTLVSDNDPVALNVKPQFDSFSQKVTEMKNIFVTAQASSFSQQIFEADSWRDQLLVGIITTVKGFTYHFDSAMRDCAGLLQNNIRLYGTEIANSDLLGETSKIESIVGDWRTKTDLVNAVDMLGLLEWVMQLETANNEFKRLYALRTDEYAHRTDETMKSKRVEVTATYEELCQFLNSYSVINRTNPAYAEVISGINAYVDQHITLLKQRGTHKKEVKPQEN